MRPIEFCYTPEHGSWLNVAECELSAMTRQCAVEWRMRIDDARCKLKAVSPKIIL
ncbi:MAG: hypothetical protein OXH99_25250 [Bryobacterales bacterium]|nr:hypothetical protein [Bryobacterales bacterium]